MYPRVLIDKAKYRHNLRTMLDTCHDKGLSVMAVSKVFCADSELINIMIEEEVDYIADSRIKNLMSFDTSIPKVLLRLPMINEAKLVVEHTDISLNSEIETIRVLDHMASHINKTHGVILMIDLGDLREGIFNEVEVYDTVSKILECKNIKLKGIGTNLTCYGGVIPSVEILNQLVEYKDKIEKDFDIILDIISGGNSSSIELIQEGKIPQGINNVRLGESIVNGRETAYGTFIDGLFDDVITLEAEIIELKEKPSIPIGEIGMNAFGKVPEFVDNGIRKRAILAIGKQDVDHTEIIPCDRVSVLGSSSDHIIVDVSEGYNMYLIGDPILFKLTYASVLSVMTSPYVKKVYVG